jgi:N-acyl-D-aspartate/D-glutamate deacylase
MADPWDVTFDFLADEEGSAEFVTFFRSGEDAKLMIAHPYAIIESDTCSAAPYGVLGELRDFKAYNLVVKVLREYVRERGILTLEEAVRKLTSLPAAAIGLKDRGLVREGMWADLAIFDPRTLAEGGSFADPQHYPIGMDYVLVNGQVIVDHNKHTGLVPGKIIKGTESIHAITP